MNIGIVIATPLEFKPFDEYAQTQDNYTQLKIRGHTARSFTTKKDRRVTAVLCGIGKVNAAAAAAFLIEYGADIMFNMGLSGAVLGVRKDEIIAGSAYMEADFDLTPLGLREFEKPDQDYIYHADPALLDVVRHTLPGIKTGAIACGDYFLTDADKKAHLKQNYKILAFDMESGAIASVCHKCAVAFVSVRLISDNADGAAAEEYTAKNDLGEAKLTQAVVQCINNL